MVKSAQVHRVIDQTLGTWLKANGYRSRGRIWYKKIANKNIVLWMKLNKYGYDEKTGSSLWLDCQCSEVVSKDLAEITVPPSTVCTKAQLAHWSKQKRIVLKKILDQPDLGIAGELFRGLIEMDFHDDYRRGSVADMPYLHLKDVQAWAELLVEIIPALETECRRQIQRTALRRR